MPIKTPFIGEASTYENKQVLREELNNVTKTEQFLLYISFKLQPDVNYKELTGRTQQISMWFNTQKRLKSQAKTRDSYQNNVRKA